MKSKSPFEVSLQAFYLFYNHLKVDLVPLLGIEYCLTRGKFSTDEGKHALFKGLKNISAEQEDGIWNDDYYGLTSNNNYFLYSENWKGSKLDFRRYFNLSLSAVNSIFAVLEDGLNSCMVSVKKLQAVRDLNNSEIAFVEWVNGTMSPHILQDILPFGLKGELILTNYYRTIFSQRYNSTLIDVNLGVDFSHIMQYENYSIKSTIFILHIYIYRYKMYFVV